MTIIYIDVSHHDWSRRGGQLDWAAVRAQTSPIMCARATYGDPSGFHPTTYHFGDFQDGARGAGFMLRGAYHNLIHGDAASHLRQAQWLKSEADRYDCQWVMADVERYAELVSNGLWPRWTDVVGFQKAWQLIDPRPLAWYIPQWLYNGYYAGQDLRVLNGPLIQSHYVSYDGTPQQIYVAAGGDTGTGWDDSYGNRLPNVWQYSSSANVSGASSNTDVNAYRGTVEQFTTLVTGAVMTDPQLITTNWRLKGIQDLKEVIDNHVNNTNEPAPLVTLLLQMAAGISAARADIAALLSAIGQTEVILDEEQITRLATQVAAILVAAPDNPLSDADYDRVVAAMKQALREGAV